MGRCDTCRGRQRGSYSRRRETRTEIYGSEWPRIRLDFLTRHPHCTLCPRQAEVADHYPRGIRLLRKHGVQEPHQDRYLRPLCKQCHDKETARREPGGWNRDRSR
jgi:5-methylcytosine-specific restriction protein A